MKMITGVFYAVWLLILVIFQPTLVQSIGILGISPNIPLIFIVMTALLRGKKEGAICGAIFGFVFDVMIGRLIGVSSLLFMYIGALAGLVSENILSDTGVIATAILIFVSNLIYASLYYIAYSMLWGDMGIITAVTRVILPESLYTAVFTMLFFFPIRKSFSIISKRNFF